jgi:hypothetical protein
MDEDIKGVLSHGVSGPPLGIRAADIIERGGRIRRRRKRLAVAGSSLATVAVIALGALAVGARGGDAPVPVQPAGPGLSTLAPTPPLETPPTAQPEPEVGPDGRPGTTTTPDEDPRGASPGTPPRPPQASPATTSSPKRAPSATAPRSGLPTAVTTSNRVR